jgi:hypothetical protein
MNNKDFLDKQLMFTENGKLYVYYSSVSDEANIKENPPKTDRAKTILGIQKMERRDDGKIVYSMLMQCDLKVKITPKLIAMFLPSGL